MLTAYSIIIFFFALYFSRKNVFALIYLLITAIFIYGRYIFIELRTGYSIGEPEWLFPGVSSDAVYLYQIYFVIFLTIFSISLTTLKKATNFRINPPQLSGALMCLIMLVGFAGLYRGYLYTVIILSEGYIAAVDFSPPWYVSAITSTFLKPMAIWFALIAISNENRKWRNIFFAYVFIVALTWQRSDLIGLILIFFGLKLTVAAKNGEMMRVILLAVKYISLIFIIGYSIFYFRESGWEPADNILADVLWAQGISVNPGLYIFQNIKNFNPSDALGFPIPYIFCGIGKILTDICRTDERLNYPGFLFEKIMALIGIDADGSFLGLGGNIIGSLYVSSKIFDYSEIDFVIFIVFSFIYSFIIVRILGNSTHSVLACLVVSYVLISSRYGFNGMIPPLNQIVAALFFDWFNRKNSRNYF